MTSPMQPIPMYHISITRLMERVMRVGKKEFMRDRSDCAVYLQRTQWVLDALGNPERQIPHYIHVGGTSGKGSTVAMIHNCIRAAGHRVGSTYSPHLTSFTERFLVDEQFISPSQFTAIAFAMEDVLDRCERESPFGMISFFELMFIMSIMHFAREGVEYAVIEVGMGGRYDASNVIPTPDVTIITNVGRDHWQLIGPTRKDIAQEKSGIIKRGTTLIHGVRTPELQQIVMQQCATEPPAALLEPQQPQRIRVTHDGTAFVYDGHPYRVAALGAHQASNAGFAIEAARALHIPDTAIRAGLAATTRPGCMERVGSAPTIYIDGAHNTDKMRATVATLRALTAPEIPVHVVLAISSDKDARAMIRLLAKRATTLVATQYVPAGGKQPYTASALAAIACEFMPSDRVRVVEDAHAAFAAVLATASKDAIVLCTGSLYLAGTLRSRYVSEDDILLRGHNHLP